MSEDYEVASLRDLVPDADNSRVHTPRSTGSIVDSIHVAGIGRGIVIDEDNVVQAGNGTVEAALEAVGEDGKVIIVDQEPDTIVAVRRRGLTKAQQVRLALDDNRSHELSKFDDDILRQQSEEILKEIPIERWQPMWTAADMEPIDLSKSDVAAIVPNTAKSRHSERKLLVVFGKYRFELTAAEDEALDAVITRWIDAFGSVAGCGSALAAALGEVVGDGQS